MDLVITVCDEAAEECPYFPHARHQEHWGFPIRVKPSALKRAIVCFQAGTRSIAERMDVFLANQSEEPLHRADS
jgi:hypothetical protein